MTQLDKNLIQQKAKLINQDLQHLQQLAQNLTRDQFLTDLTIQLQVERLFERIIGRLIDINYHYLKEKVQELPEDYYHSFIKMGEQAAGLEQDLAANLAQAAGMRNVLAHEYDVIDLNLVYGAIDDMLEQVPAYLQQVLELINN